MGSLYKGYSVDFGKFWTYYKATARADHSRYRNQFERCFKYQMSKAGCGQGVYSNTVDIVEKKLNGLCQKTRTAMLSDGVPATSVNHIIDHFKKWFRSYYGN